MIKEKEELVIKYKNYLNSNNTRWTFHNSILYRMCEENPNHNKEDVIAGKICLIGRSYAAAIERRRDANETNDDFYFDVVAPKMIKIGRELDDRIEKLNRSANTIAGDIDLILSTHKFLTDAFREMTGLDKRSLASKYLHFHCPQKFFIYDSRARQAIGKIVTRPDKNSYGDISGYDPEYADFVIRMLELQDYLYKRIGSIESPRRLDSFLLS